MWLMWLGWLFGGPAALAQAAAPAQAAVQTPLQAPAQTVHLSAGTQAVDAWSAVRVLADPDAALDEQAAWRSLARFQPPTGPYANLGPQRGAAWLLIPVQVEADATAHWMLRLGYSLLHEVHLSVRDAQGQTVHEARLGALVPFEQRTQKTRALTSLLALRPGERYQVLLRVATPTGVLLPIAFLQHSALGTEESQEQAFQGALSGVWGFMIVYSLVHGVITRQRLFFAYAGTLTFSWIFAQAVSGVGTMFLWPGNAWLAANMSALAPLPMVCCNTLFLLGALEARRDAPRTWRAMIAVAAGTLLLAALYVVGLVGYRLSAMVSMVLGVAHLSLAVPLAVRRLREGERTAAVLLAGAASNLLGVALFSLLLRGHLPVNFLTVHGIQFGILGEMLCWMLVLGLRLEQLRQAAAAARLEHESLQRLALTDALTGLCNRRGLELALRKACLAAPGDAPGAAPALALYMIDLDGFKPVNDRWGHDAGDLLLHEVGRRLVAAVRQDDVVARLGGDEFVVACAGVRSTADAQTLGAKLLAAFEAPFDLGEQRQAAVSATIGCSLATGPGCDARRLLREADAAMYAGKQAGKRRVMTAGPAGAVDKLLATADAGSTRAAAAEPQAISPC